MPASKHAGRSAVLGTALAAALTVAVPAATADAFTGGTAPTASTGAVRTTSATTATSMTPVHSVHSASAAGAAGAVSPRAARVLRAWRVARHQIGDPYAYGRTGPGSFDCSGLTYYAFHRMAHFRGFPRTSGAQARFAHHIARGQLRKGDLVFFTSGGRVYHAAIFAGWQHGRRTVLHAPYPGARVRIDPIWTNGWFARTLRH
jgi:cell wall-associated NlpC family hydrolase